MSGGGRPRRSIQPIVPAMVARPGHECGEPEDSEPAASEPEKRKAPAALNPITVLRELFELLEDYAPAWYSEENHRRAEAILKAGAR